MFPCFRIPVSSWLAGFELPEEPAIHESPPPVNRIYHFSWRDRAFAAIFLSISLILAAAALNMPGPSTDGLELLLFVLGVFSSCAGIAAILDTFTATIAFIPGGIQKHTLFGNKTLPLHVIRGVASSGSAP